MKTSKLSQHTAHLFVAMLVAAAIALLPAQLRAADQKSDVKQRTFASPEEAVKALVDATKAADHAQLHEIFRPDGKQLVTGDEVQDAAAFGQFCKAVAQMCTPVPQGDDKVILDIGANNWPFPIPLVKKDGQWFFDTAAGKEEIINRHIGEDELNAIGVCRAYVTAQRQYASMNGGVYALKFKSSPGKKDGLYWPVTENEPASPFGPVVAEAHVEGYHHHAGAGPQPFHGYYFRILTRQGDAAPGGEMN